MKLAVAWLVVAQISGEGLDERFRFCHEDRYPLLEEERAWCDIAPTDNPRCPRFAEVCQAGVEAEVDEYREIIRRGKGAASPDGDERKEKKPELEVPTALSGLAKVLFFAILALGLGALLWALFRDRFSARLEEEVPDTPKEGPEPEEQPARLVLTDVERLLAEAEKAAAAGRYGEAIELAYAAALRRLDGDGLIDMHHSRTNGDYLRNLSAQPELAAHMRELVRDVERVQFGATEADRSRFDAVIARVMPVAMRAAALVAILFGLGCDFDERQREPSELIGGGFSPSGLRAFMELVSEDGIDIDHRLEPLAHVGDETAVLLVFPGGGPEDEDWAAVFDWVERGGLLVLAGESPDHDALSLKWLRTAGFESRITPSGLWARDLEEREIRIPPGPSLEPTIGGYEADPILLRGAAPDGPIYAIEQGLGEGLVIALADEVLFTNVSMTVADNAQVALFVSDPMRPGKVEICTILTGSGARSPMDSIHRARLTPFILQLLVLLALFMIHRGRAFGRLRDPPAHQRRAFVDHVRALGTQYARARASGRAAGAYAHWAIEQLRDRIPRGRQRDLEEIAEEVAARTGQPPQEVAALLQMAQQTSDLEGPPSTSRMPGLAGQLPFANEAERISIVRRLAELLSRAGHGRRQR